MGAVRRAGQGRLARPDQPGLAGPAPRPDRSGGEYHLDGRFVTDVPGLHCAVLQLLERRGATVVLQ
ncbi:hypothetical protein ABZW32_18135 [Streptomyces sp. NPDC004667]|uniref:hypothetical protein n=1 Tax=Streptomyces sp. NPDC004667 TaxID=3154285 RepID=UPI0033BF5BE6